MYHLNHLYYLCVGHKVFLVCGAQGITFPPFIPFWPQASLTHHNFFSPRKIQHSSFFFALNTLLNHCKTIWNEKVETRTRLKIENMFYKLCGFQMLHYVDLNLQKYAEIFR